MVLIEFEIMNINDITLQQYIDQIFNKFDLDLSGTLQAAELVNFFNEMFVMTGYPSRVGMPEAYNIMRSVDQNFDGHATRPELFIALKRLFMGNQPAAVPAVALGNMYPIVGGGLGMGGIGYGVGAMGGAGLTSVMSNYGYRTWNTQ